jgi:hypothetical protein
MMTFSKGRCRIQCHAAEMTTDRATGGNRSIIMKLLKQSDLWRLKYSHERKVSINIEGRVPS